MAAYFAACRDATTGGVAVALEHFKPLCFIYMRMYAARVYALRAGDGRHANSRAGVNVYNSSLATATFQKTGE